MCKSVVVVVDVVRNKFPENEEGRSGMGKRSTVGT